MAKPTIKKICFVVAVLACLGASVASAADSTVISTSAMQIGGGTFSPSNKVSLMVAVGPTGCTPTGTVCQQYAAKSKHASGDRIIATNNLDPKIYYKTVATTLVTEAIAATEEFTATGTWTAM